MKVSLALAWGAAAAFATWFGLSAAWATGETVSTWFKNSNINPVLVQGTDGTDAKPISVDSSGNVQIESASGSTLVVGGPAADDAAASGNPVPIGCKHNTTTNAVEDGDISYVNCGTLGDVYVSGRVASAATDAGNPVKVGAKYNSTKPTFTDGQRGDLQIGTRGALHTTLCDEDSTGCVDTTNGNGDDAGGGGTHLSVSNYNKIFDGSTWDRTRAVINATDSTGTGIAAAGILAQYDDTSPTAITENQFGNVRMSSDRGLLGSRKVNGGTLESSFTCDQSAVISVAAAATTELVALSASQVIRVCAFTITGDTAVTTATFVYGTGSNCATGQAALTGAMRMVDEGNISNSAAQGSLFRTASANALCLTAATGAVTGFVSYAKF